MFSDAHETSLAVSESRLLSSNGAWEYLQLLRGTGEVNQSVCEVCIWLVDHFTFY